MPAFVIRLAFAIIMSCVSIAAAKAQDQAAGIVVTQAWSRATPGGAKVAGGYLIIENRGQMTDRLLSGSTEAAKKVEIHEMAVIDGVMTMRPVQEGLAIGAGQTVKFVPGGLHLMLVGLTAPLKQGDLIQLSLKFENAGEIVVPFEVKAMGAQAPGPLSHTAPTSDASGAAAKM